VTDHTDGRGQGPEQPEKLPVGLIVASALAAVLVIFMFSNNHRAPIKFLGFDTATPLWLIIFGSMLVGIVIGWLGSSLRRRAKQRNQNS
jgi:uncharacterized integral membrane protein